MGAIMGTNTGTKTGANKPAPALQQEPNVPGYAPHTDLSGPPSAHPLNGRRQTAAMRDLLVRQTSHDDVDALIDLQRRIYPDIAPWSPQTMHHQLEQFPEGQVVALVNDKVVGCASSIVINWNNWQSVHTWDSVTADGSFDTHDPNGLTLYGAEVFVDPAVRGRRIGHWLYDARRKICRRLNLKRVIACGRLPGYHKYALEMSAESYAKRVVWGDIIDPVLNFQLREGFDFCGVIEGYLPEDKESGGFASLIVWLNPSYKSSRPTRVPGATPARS